MAICAQNGCDKKTRSAKYCNIHRCTKKDCDEDVVDGFRRCETHGKRCKLCALFTNRIYCKRHECEINGCGCIKVKYYKLCLKHKCEAYDCVFRSIENTKYCDLHTCEIQGCNNENLPQKKYCRYHTCVVCGEVYPHARKSIYIDGYKKITQFCDDHKCGICGSESYTIIEVKDRQIVVCEFHSVVCNKIDCTDYKYGNYIYCPYHNCFFDNCNQCAKNRVEIDRISHDSINLCDVHTQYAIKQIKKYNTVDWHNWKTLRIAKPAGRYCSIMMCMNKVVPKNMVCLDHYWKPKCLYCLSDDKCAISCSHKCDMPCTNGRCKDMLYMRKHKTKHNYYSLSHAKFIVDNAPMIIPQMARIIAEYL